MTESDAALVAAMARGEERAASVLYDRWAAMLLAVAARITRDRSEAEEVVAEAFVQAWRAAGKFEPGRGSVAAWLTTMARSRALDLVRARGRRHRHEAAAGEEPNLPISHGQGPAAPDVPVEAGERRQAVRAALAELPDPQRRALELAYYQGLSQSQIAEELGEPVGTIKTRTRLAMQKLREALRPHYFAEPVS